MSYYEKENYMEFYELMLLIKQYNNPQSENRTNIEKMFSSDKKYIMQCKSDEMLALLKQLDKTTPLYQILIKQICDNLDELLFSDYKSNFENERPYEDIFDIKKFLGQIDELRDKIESIFQTHQKEVIERIYEYVKYKEFKNYYESVVDDYKQEMLTFLESLIYDLCNRDINGIEKKNGKIKFNDIEKLGEGVYSVVYGIDDKVIKIGRNRGIWEIPDNPYIVKPIIREKIKVGKGDYLSHLYVEVVEKVNPITEADITQTLEEELYELYANLRQLGIIWVDVKFNNVGRLMKMQDIPFTSNEFMSIKQNRLYKEKIQLPQNSLVILDADLMMLEDDFYERCKMKNFADWMSPLAYKFYKRYEKEYININKGGK